MEDEQIQEVINKQKPYWAGRDFVLAKEEMTVIGCYLKDNRYKPHFSENFFSTHIADTLWKEIKKSNFTISEEDLKESTKKCLSNEENLDEFIKTSKILAQGITDNEYTNILCRIYRMYQFNNICNNISCYNKDKFFKDRAYILAKSERIYTLSLDQLEKLLISYNEQSSDDIIANSNRLPQNLTSFLENKTKEQDKGIPLPFTLVDKAINGLRKGQLLATGMMSNDGKTRLMVRLVANLSIIQNKKVLIISNEMTEEDIKYAFITSIINNIEFKDMLKDITTITKTEREIRNGIYATEDEQQQVKQITSYIEEKFSNNVIVIHTTQYTSQDLKDIILTHYLENSIDYFFYDTLKADIDTMSNWDGLKATGTVLSELAKEYNICIWANIQLVNSPQPLQASVDNIANSKQLYHILDTLLLFIPIPKSEYADFRYWASSSNPNNGNIQKLDTSKKYYACTILKNRIGAKPNLLFEVNLDQNTWEEVGQVARYKDVKRFLDE